MEKGEIRQNKVTKRWVVFAPGRGKRPKDFAREETDRNHLPEYDPDCPFCPGNESSLPEIIEEAKTKDGAGWLTRVIPNKFPALSPDGSDERFAKGIYVAMDGVGRHEVIIESPFHNKQIALMTAEETEGIVESYHRRYEEIMARHEEMMIVIFRNHGQNAGTSLVHPHSQLIAVSWTPRHVRLEEMEAERYFDQIGHCVYCDILNYEIKEGTRIVMDNESFTAFVPFAADVPFEVWIVPHRHEADFGTISDREKADLSVMVNRVMKLLYRGIGDPDYNYVVKTSARFKTGEPHLHWCLQIFPRLTTRAGFEIGSGISINPSFPEDDAQFLRELRMDDE